MDREEINITCLANLHFFSHLINFVSLKRGGQEVRWLPAVSTLSLIYVPTRRNLFVAAAGLLQQQANSCDTFQADISIHSSHLQRHTATEPWLQAPLLLQNCNFGIQLKSMVSRSHRAAFIELAEIIMRCLLGNAFDCNERALRKEQPEVRKTRACRHQSLHMHYSETNLCWGRPPLFLKDTLVDQIKLERTSQIRGNNPKLNFGTD